MTMETMINQAAETLASLFNTTKEDVMNNRKDELFAMVCAGMTK